MKNKGKTNSASPSTSTAPSATATVSGSARPATPAQTFAHEHIAGRARSIWEREGRPERRDEEFWLRAERELREGEARAADERRFADPDRLTDRDGDPADDVDRSLDRLAGQPGERSPTSL